MIGTLGRAPSQDERCGPEAPRVRQDRRNTQAPVGGGSRPSLREPKRFFGASGMHGSFLPSVSCGRWPEGRGVRALITEVHDPRRSGHRPRLNRREGGGPGPVRTLGLTIIGLSRTPRACSSRELRAVTSSHASLRRWRVHPIQLAMRWPPEAGVAAACRAHLPERL